MRIAIAGAAGRMGRMLIEATLAAPDLTLAVALEHPGSAEIGHDAAAFLGRASGVAIGADLAAVRNADVLIDFTRPAGTLAHLVACRSSKTKLVIGTTGFDESGVAAIKAASGDLAIVHSPNMSVGVNAVFKLLELTTKMLALDPASACDIEVIETHHRMKVDAPSGTALKMGEVIATAMGRKLSEIAVDGRHGNTGARVAGTIGFSAIRGGDIVGDHTVLFAGDGERIEITHRSASRMNYATGALRAARFLARRNAGLFDMFDVLGLR
jgi:4-hydroxy-tetrahydrodipicolinate reductase